MAEPNGTHTLDNSHSNAGSSDIGGALNFAASVGESAAILSDVFAAAESMFGMVNDHQTRIVALENALESLTGEVKGYESRVTLAELAADNCMKAKEDSPRGESDQVWALSGDLPPQLSENGGPN